MPYTPILKSTGVRLIIENPEFEEGFLEHCRIPRKRYGIVKDLDTGARYKIYGKSCNISTCGCDAYAVPIED